MTFLLLIDYY